MCARAFENILGHVSVQGRVRVCEGMLVHMRTCEDVQECVTAYEDVQGHVRTCEPIQGSVSVRGHART